MCFLAVSHVFSRVLAICVPALLSQTEVMSVPFVYSPNSSSVALHVQSYVQKMFCTDEARLLANGKGKAPYGTIIVTHG